MYYRRKAEFNLLDPAKYPEIINLVSLLETMCFNPTLHIVVAYVLGVSVRFLLVKDQKYLATHYDLISIEEGISYWPNFSWYKLERILVNFFVEAGLVYDPLSGQQRGNKSPMERFFAIAKG